jgi:hypothetical protein
MAEQTTFLWLKKPQGWVGLKFRAENALRDLGDRLRGRCCRAPNYMVDGGYHFWRCGLKRGHDGPHRSVNYLWGPGGWRLVISRLRPDDLSTCPYFKGEGTCDRGCHSEPACIVDRPTDGWPGERSA